MKIYKKLGYNKMYLRKLKNSNNGVVGIVVAVLLIGLLVTFISIIQLYYVPKWMKEKEAEHMTIVSNQFSQLKFAIDSQIALGALGKTGIPMTSPFTLGSTELPFFVSMPAYGQLDIIDNDTACIITFKAGEDYWPYSLGIIRYSSINAYLEDQSFVYESGAIITSQTEGNIVAVKPFFKTNTTGGDFKINFTLIDITSVGGKTTSQTSTDATAIQTEYSSNQPNPNIIIVDDVDSITINTAYPNAWHIFIDSILKNAGKDGAYSINNPTPTQTVVSFYDLPTIIIEKYSINAQIGPGWIQK